MLQEEEKQDSFYETLPQAQVSNQLIHRDGVWFKNGKVYLSLSSVLIQQVVTDCHLSPTGRYFGFHKTLSRIKASFLWPNMRQAVKKFL